MSAQPINTIIEQTNSLSIEDKRALAEYLLAEASEQEQREKQKIKNQDALELIKKWQEDNSGYEEENWPGIQEAIEATIRK